MQLINHIKALNLPIKSSSFVPVGSRLSNQIRSKPHKYYFYEVFLWKNLSELLKKEQSWRE